MKIPYINFYLFFSVLLVVSCSSSDGGGGTNDDDGGGGTAVPPPAAASLIFPENNTECNEGVIVNETTSTVTFRWGASQNTDTYTVNITNLADGESSTINATTNEAPINIVRGAPYEWSVTSRANGTSQTAQSPSFRFYNEGPGVENYAPFPAQATNPVRGANLSATTSSVTLEWSSSDIDGDIASYEVFFGTDPAMLNFIATPTENSVSNVSVSTGTIYYWSVTSTDDLGNSSTSEIFQFRIL